MRYGLNCVAVPFDDLFTAARVKRALPITLLTCFIFLFESSLAYSQSEAQTRQYQEMLIWVGYYDGIIDGKLGSDTRRAIKRFQTQIGHAPNGTLTTQEAGELARLGTQKKISVGFSEVIDWDAGVSVGIPHLLVPIQEKTKWGTSWRAKNDLVVIDTLRFADTTLKELYDKLSHINNRRVDYSVFKDDWFVISGTDPDGSGVYVRAQARANEIRGFSLWISKQELADLGPLPPAMSSSFELTSQAAAITPHATVPAHSTPNPPVLTPNPPPVLPPAVSILACKNGLGDCPEAFAPR